MYYMYIGDYIYIIKKNFHKYSNVKL
uniref:Uncharacterized protein n=1 Tax=Anguilla anguilla TaxID=7936 RepID=A0A0E9UD26_ANGAN